MLEISFKLFKDWVVPAAMEVSDNNSAAGNGDSFILISIHLALIVPRGS